MTQDISANKSFVPKSDTCVSQIQTINCWPHDPQLCRHTPFWSLLPYPSYLIRHSLYPNRLVSFSLFLCEHRAFSFFDRTSLSFSIHYSSKVMNTDPSSFFSVLGAYRHICIFLLHTVLHNSSAYSAYTHFVIKVTCYINEIIYLFIYITNLTKDRFYGGTFCDKWRKMELNVPSGRTWCYECWTTEPKFRESATSIYTASVYHTSYCHCHQFYQ